MDYINLVLASNQDWLPYWQPDNTAIKCSSTDCFLEFGVINRKHHCRNCGKIFCDECCSKEMFVERYGKDTKVCKKCFEEKKGKN